MQNSERDKSIHYYTCTDFYSVGEEKENTIEQKN